MKLHHVYVIFYKVWKYDREVEYTDEEGKVVNMKSREHPIQYIRWRFI